MTGDNIRLQGIACRVHLGVPETERVSLQPVRIDVEMRVNLDKSGQSDDVRDTVDYWAVEQKVRETAETGEFRLAERLAEVVARAVFTVDLRIQAVTVAVHKKPGVMPKTDEVVVEIIRERI